MLSKIYTIGSDNFFRMQLTEKLVKFNTTIWLNEENAPAIGFRTI